VTATGQNVQGWNAVNGVVNPNGAVSDLTVPIGATVPATATTTMNLALNLDASAATNATFSAPIQVYDSLGTAHTLTFSSPTTEETAGITR